MFLKQLKLTNFRNYTNLDLIFDDRTTVLLGDNAAGKSNVLESIYFLSTTKSNRVENEGELMKDGEGVTRVEGKIENKGDSTELVIVLSKQEQEEFKKRVLVNGISRRVVDFVGNLPAVIFYPSDIEMVAGSPSLRRWHLDVSLAQVDWEYKRALGAFEQFVTARNRVLKRIREGEGKIDELTYWTEGLLTNAGIVHKKREEFFEFTKSLKDPLGDFSFRYKQSEISLEKLINTQPREIAAAATLIGPHRDDYVLELNSRHLAHFGSRGEQRTATLAFKLAQLEFMAFKLGKRPLLLLDDVFSELDANHRAYVVSIVNRQQTIISTVELENIPQEFLDSARILNVAEGNVIGG